MISFSCQPKAQEKDSEGHKTAQTHSTVKLTKQEFLDKVYDFEKNPQEWKYKGDKPAIIDFYADWCGPCRMTAPVLEALAKEYGDKIVIYKVDTQKEREISAAFGIQSLPSLLFIPLNEKPQLAKGAMPKEAFEEAIEKVLKVTK
ncbi:thioredoxin [Halosquirtibacter laminarini]|uniref:Thioredoxin n=2 Tax=Halosquirtibacter laminarini TaxID=3374600 RepID=A0AC61NJK0_9BACT|nr:thioredoxin [Prolixibacteraceae bacterium]